MRIFINYRREDTSGHAGRLFDALAARFGDDHIFMDVDGIRPGEDFTEAINTAVSSCDVLISIIGKRWLTLTDVHGTRRLDNPDDFVRLEIQAALDRGVKVIPIRVQEAVMPRSDELPETIRPFARRNAIELADDRWHLDLGRLVEALEDIEREKTDVGPRGVAPAPPPPVGRPRVPPPPPHRIRRTVPPPPHRGAGQRP